MHRYSQHLPKYRGEQIRWSAACSDLALFSFVFNLAHFIHLFFNDQSLFLFLFVSYFISTLVFKYILLIVLLQVSHVPPLHPSNWHTPSHPHLPLLLMSMGNTYKSSLPSTFPLLYLCSLCLFSTYHLDNRHNCPHYFLLLFQYSCLHFPTTTLAHPIVMVKEEYGEINVCMKTWLGLSHMKKVTECKRLDCYGVCRLYWSGLGGGLCMLDENQNQN